MVAYCQAQTQTFASVIKGFIGTKWFKKIGLFSGRDTFAGIGYEKGEFIRPT